MTEFTLTKKGKILEFSIAVILIIIGIVFRFLPHPPNFTPIAAIALFGGVYFSRKLAFILPMAAMVISDIFIGFYEPKLMASVYGSFLLCVVLGFWLKKNKKWYTVLGGSISASIIFFVITNFAVWAFTFWYPHNFSGLIQCYLMALPFFKNTLLGDLSYVIILFGTYELAEAWVRKKFAIPKEIPISITANQ